MWSNGMDLRVKNLMKDMKGVLKVKKKGEELSGGVHTDPGTVYFGTAWQASSATRLILQNQIRSNGPNQLIQGRIR